MKTSDIETNFWDAFFSGEYDPELYTEFFGLQDSDKETAKETATQTQTKTVTRGIYNRVPVGNGQFRRDKVGETVVNYAFEVVDAVTLRINGKCYRVEDCSEFAIKVMKTKIKAIGGAKGLIKFLCRETLDSWELKIIENCKPINLN